ncbi:uncharacterized protein LOC111262813 isoform X1 [Varroa jacobsoni]|uniref:uncharacterized protein LOC111262813 isoform X1 n=2 Tax=Varroa jacobsoni TaxID=62625 RepID=UPI000BF502F2|nr:uncharacterized protein LOC111262813 isoform X1 [Varroa jacobsoni]
MCVDCAGFSVNRKPRVRTFMNILNDATLINGSSYGTSPVMTAGAAGVGIDDPHHIFTCFNCWQVKDSLWIVSHAVDTSAVDECLCCAQCLCGNLIDPSFARDRRITLRCGGDGCQLQLDAWTKGSKLVTSLVKDHTVNCPFRPVFCPKGCKAVLRRQDQSLHEESCPLSTRSFERESQKMQDVEKRLVIPASQMRYRQLANVPTTAVRKEARSVFQQGHHESLRQDAVIVCQRSTAAPVCDQTQNEENGSSPPAGSRPGVTSRRGEVPTALRRSSVESPASSLAETSFKQLTNGLNNGSPPRTYNMSDETLEQLEKARLALERECIKVPDGVSCLPDVIAQRINNEDAELRDRVEKLEELIVTTRAQLEKAFAENRNLRALLASEHKLHELHVTKLRDEVEILRSIVYRSFRQNTNSSSSDDSSHGTKMCSPKSTRQGSIVNK